MKSLPEIITSVFLVAIMIFMSCKKETSCEDCAAKTNNPPIAVAGPDQVITLPTDSVFWMAGHPVTWQGG